MVNATERIKVQTSVTLEFHYRNGEQKVVDLGSNIIVLHGRSDMAHLIAGDDVANRIVGSAKFSDGGHDPENPTAALIPTGNETEVPGTVVIEKATDYDFPDGDAGTKVRFSCTVTADEGNGSGAQAISSVGLYDVDGSLMCLKNFGLISKSEAFAIVLRYVLNF